MSKLVAVQNCTFKYETTPSGSVTLAVSVVEATGKNLSGGKRAHVDEITINVLSGTVKLDSTPEATPPASSNEGTVPPGTIIINGTSLKSTTDRKKFVLKGDSGSAVFSCIFPSSTYPYTTTAAVTIKATVDDTNQNVLKVT